MQLCKLLSLSVTREDLNRTNNIELTQTSYFVLVLGRPVEDGDNQCLQTLCSFFLENISFWKRRGMQLNGNVD